MKKQIIFYLLLLCTGMNVSAQNVGGTVRDAAGQPMNYVNVVVLQQTDSAFVAGVTTDDAGRFELAIAEGCYLLKATCIGYEEQTVACMSPGKVDIVLHESSVLLGDVEVKGVRPAHELTPGGVRTQVAGTLLSRLGTMDDVLKNIPGLRKDRENIEVFGRGNPLVYINGRKVTDIAELNQLQSSEIKSIELLTNPGVKYDASARAVLIIRTLRPTGEGFGFDLRSSAYLSEGPDFTEEFNLNYRRRGLDIFGKVRYDNYKQVDKSNFWQEIAADTLWQQHNVLYSDNHFDKLRLNIGGNYVFDDNHSVGLLYKTHFVFFDRSLGTFNSSVTANGQYYDQLDNDIDGNETNPVPHSFNFYYNGKVAGTGIDFNADYLYSGKDQHNITEEHSEAWEDRRVTSISKNRNEMVAAKLVLSHDLWGGSLSVGAEYNALVRKDDYVNPELVVPTSYTEMREKGMAAFAEYSKQTRLGVLRGGLRYEWVKTNYYNRGVFVPEQSRRYDDWFPNFSLVTKIGKVQTSVGYSASISRPNFSQLRSGVLYANRFTWESGNPFLKSAITHTLSLSAAWKIIRVMVDYSNIRNSIIYFGEQVKGQESTTLLKPINIDHSKLLSVQTVLEHKIGWWQPQLTFGLLKNWMTIETINGTIRPKKPGITVKMNHLFNFSPSLTGEVTAFFSGKRDFENMSTVREEFILDVGLTKTFFDDRLSVRVAGYDLFKRAGMYIKSYFEQMVMLTHRNRDTREFEITVRYKLNTTKSKYKGTGAGNHLKKRL